jgi:hypothetical protein
MSKGLRDLIAPPAPAIIDYIKHRNFERLDAIVANWEASGKLSILQADLGLSEKRREGRPRTQHMVNEETDIVDAVVGAAMNGKDNPFAGVAAELRIPVRKVRSTWNNWSQERLNMLRSLAKHYDSRGFPDAAKANRTAIKILEKHEE